MKYTLFILMTVIIIGAGYWYASRAGWFNAGPNNLPTEEEWERIRAIDQAASQIDPNAKAGVGVAAPGTLPPPPPIDTATSTASTTESATISSEDDMSTSPDAEVLAE